MRGNILAAISQESFKEVFELTREGDKYGASLTVAALAVANEDVVEEAQPKI